MAESNRPQRKAGRPAWLRDMVSLQGSSSEDGGQLSSCRSNIEVDDDVAGIRSVMNSFSGPLPATQSNMNASSCRSNIAVDVDVAGIRSVMNSFSGPVPPTQSNTNASSPPTNHDTHLPLNDDQQQENDEEVEQNFCDAPFVMHDRELAAILQGEEFRKANKDSPPDIVDTPRDANQTKKRQHDVSQKNTEGTTRTGVLRSSITPSPIEVMHVDADCRIVNATEPDGESVASLERREIRYQVDPTNSDLGVASRDVELVKLQKIVKNLRVLVTDTFDKWNRRLNKFEAMMEQLDGPEFPCKPDCLPIRKLSHLTAFENLSREEHAGVVYYLSKLGGSNVNECANIMLKEALHDKMAPKVNYYGRHEGTTSLEKTKFVKVLYKSMARNRNLHDLAMDVFANAIITALRAAKQRRRNVMNRRRDEGRQQR